MPTDRGLSPRMRGNLLVSGASTPRSWVYPRACGGTVYIGSSRVTDEFSGLSPRMRGNRRRRCRRVSCPWVYPRACGGTSTSLPGELPARGSIPAHAGEPLYGRGGGVGIGVYPRACGGTTTVGQLGDAMRGLSPRMRGNLKNDFIQTSTTGSIPAHAGEPGIAGHGAHGDGVYPRACGGTRRTLLSTSLLMGSIPAHAGEPKGVLHVLATHRVYPRACGGTQIPLLNSSILEGSIPAHAGEPA